MEAGRKLDDYLRSPGLSEQFALMVYAHLVADGKLVPIHKRHTVGDICTFLQFLYKRTATSAQDTPSNGLWKSVEDARPIIRFAHKFNMQTILHECDTCLSQKAEADSEGMFKDNDSIVAWAELAELCGLTTLLANAELFMVKNADPTFWKSPAFSNHKLSSSCMLRMLQAAQLTINDWSSKFVPEAPQNNKYTLLECHRCGTPPWFRMCSAYRQSKPTSTHPSLSTLISWQQSSQDGVTAPARSESAERAGNVSVSR